MPFFAKWRQKSIIIATSLDDRKKNVRLIISTHMHTYPGSSVKISPLHSAITGLQRSHLKKNKVTATHFRVLRRAKITLSNVHILEAG